MPTAEPERTGDERPELIRLMRRLADEMEEACIRDGVLPPPPPPKSEAERRARRRWGMWPAVLLVGAGLTRLARDHPAAVAVVAAMAVPAAGLVIVASPAKVPLVESSGRHDPGPARTVYVTPPVPRVTVTASPAPSSSPTPTLTPSPTPTGTGAPTPGPSPSPIVAVQPVPDSPAATQPAPPTTPADGGGSGDGGNGTAPPEPDSPPSRPGHEPNTGQEPGPPPPAETPAHAYGVCVGRLRAPLPVHVSVRVLCRHSRGRP